jgi:predicted transposase YbfD/YdcC
VFDAFDDRHGPPARVRLPGGCRPEGAGHRAAHRAGGGNYPRGSGKVEIRYFLSSCHDDPAVLVQAIRRPIENGLHWVLDVTFREDDSRVRDRTAARNLAILRKIAINLMGRNRTPRVSMRARRKQAAWNDEYMLALLAG